jgi:hypothetical protein
LALARPIRDYATVSAWINGLTEQWGEAPPDLDSRLELLARFCAFVERDPDGVIDDCSREVESGKRIRIKERRRYSEQIAEFQAAEGGDARAQGRVGNTIRSFMIHNGIFMQAGVQV